jgi:hypothetical protein
LQWSLWRVQSLMCAGGGGATLVVRSRSQVSLARTKGSTCAQHNATSASTRTPPSTLSRRRRRGRSGGMAWCSLRYPAARLSQTIRTAQPCFSRLLGDVPASEIFRLSPVAGRCFSAQEPYLPRAGMHPQAPQNACGAHDDSSSSSPFRVRERHDDGGRHLRDVAAARMNARMLSKTKARLLESRLARVAHTGYAREHSEPFTCVRIAV